jgi:hypothetical protein
MSAHVEPTSRADPEPPLGAPSDRDVHCPLCDYNLRGLTEPRCPECGHAFDWQELLTGPKKLPWFYEHRRGVALAALIKTFARGLRPGRFWAIVRPAHEVRPARLLAYALILLSVAAVGTWLPLVTSSYVRETGRMPVVRAQLRARLTDPATGNPLPELQQHLNTIGIGSLDQYLDSILPSPTLTALWYAGSTWRPMQRLAVPVIGWPILTFAVLWAYRKALGQTDVKTPHLWRVAVYCGDVAFIAWAFLLPAAHWLHPIAEALANRSDAMYFLIGGRRAAGGGMLAGLGIALICAARFTIAHRRYLGGPNSTRSAALIQLLVLLGLFRLMMLVNSRV